MRESKKKRPHGQGMEVGTVAHRTRCRAAPFVVASSFMLAAFPITIAVAVVPEHSRTEAPTRRRSGGRQLRRSKQRRAWLGAAHDCYSVVGNDAALCEALDDLQLPETSQAS